MFVYGVGVPLCNLSLGALLTSNSELRWRVGRTSNVCLLFEIGRVGSCIVPETESLSWNR